jgi:hypothetical protein
LQKKADDRYSRASEMASDLQMVKMMLDLPLNSGEASSAAGAAGTTPSLGSAKLYATTLGMKKPSTAVLQTPMRASAEAAAADAAPRAAHAPTGPLIWVGAALAWSRLASAPCNS